MALIVHLYDGTWKLSASSFPPLIPITGGAVRVVRLRTLARWRLRGILKKTVRGRKDVALGLYLGSAGPLAFTAKC